MAIDKNEILQRLQTIQDPELRRDLVTLNRIKHVAVADGVVSISVRLAKLNAPGKDALRAEIEGAVGALGDEVQRVEVEFVADLAAGEKEEQPATPQEGARAANPLPDVKQVIAVGAGKGGVGKSSIAVNLAVALARKGLKVGLMDGDIYGPSIPTMLGTDQLQPTTQGQTLIPFDVHGIKTMTIGALVEDDRPLIWRGPMAHGAFRQLVTQTHWGCLDYLIIDLPPGTGDVCLTMAQLLPLSGAIVVCTPQKVAQDDARRAVGMFRQLEIEVLGIVENMSYFIGDDGKEYDIFGKGGVELMAQTMGVPFLGNVPISMSLRRNCDAGDPTANFTQDEQLGRELEAFAAKVETQVQARAMEGGLIQPTISMGD